jgi:hypothetical protein
VDLEPGKPRAIRGHRYNFSQSVESLVQKLDGIRFELSEEEELSLAPSATPPFTPSSNPVWPTNKATLEARLQP